MALFIWAPGPWNLFPESWVPPEPPCRTEGGRLSACAQRWGERELSSSVSFSDGEVVEGVGEGGQGKAQRGRGSLRGSREDSARITSSPGRGFFSPPSEAPTPSWVLWFWVRPCSALGHPSQPGLLHLRTAWAAFQGYG